MALPGEITGGKKEIMCSDCSTKLPLRVCKSAAGWYIGYFCPNCGPYGRESSYYPSEGSAQIALEMELVDQRTTEYKGGV